MYWILLKGILHQLFLTAVVLAAARDRLSSNCHTCIFTYYNIRGTSDKEHVTATHSYTKIRQQLSVPGLPKVCSILDVTFGRFVSVKAAPKSDSSVPYDGDVGYSFLVCCAC